MKNRSIAVAGCFVMAIAFALLSVPLSGQTRGAAAKPYEPPRMPDGRPNLQGIYDLATLTPLERPAGANAILTDAEAAALERNVA